MKQNKNLQNLILSFFLFQKIKFIGMHQFSSLIFGSAQNVKLLLISKKLSISNHFIQ